MKHNYKLGDEIIFLDTENIRKWNQISLIGHKYIITQYDLDELAKYGDDKDFTLNNNIWRTNFFLSDFELVINKVIAKNYKYLTKIFRKYNIK